jgi:ribosomal protein S18 acetylase RimI-like enzyme
LLGLLGGSPRAAGCRQVQLVTTNDNMRALRFYQRRGFRLVALHPGALERSRELKPEIPETGLHGIPLSDELVLAREL